MGQGTKLFLFLLEDPDKVFGDDDGGVNNDAKVDCPHGNEVCRDTLQVQQQVSTEQGDRHGQRHDQGSAEIPEPKEKHEHKHDQANTFDHVSTNGVKSALDQFC